MLIGRGAELTEITHWLGRLGQAHGALVLIEGEAGIGKTALLNAACKQAEEAGLVVLRARGGELEASTPWAVARELLIPVLPLAGALPSTALAADPLRTAGNVLDGTAVEERGGRDQAFRATYALTCVVSQLAQSDPLVVAVDDAHWADPASLQWLGYLTARVDQIPALVLVARRTAEEGVERLHSELGRRAAQVLRLSPLAPTEVADLVRGHFGREADPEFVTVCDEVTGGNPFLLGELLRAASQAGVLPEAGAAADLRELRPVSVMRSLQAELTRLGPPAIELARAVAILGDGASPSAAGSLAELTETALTSGAATLAEAGVFASQPELGFAHPLIRTAAYESITPAKRALLHRRAAWLLHRRAAGTDAVAAQLMRADRIGDRRAVLILVEASAAARRRGAAGMARGLARRALHEPAPPELRAVVLEELGYAALEGGDYAGIDHLREAFQAAASRIDRARLALQGGRALHMVGDFEAAVRILLEGVALLGDDDDEDLRTALEVELVSAAIESPAHVELASEKLAAASKADGRADDPRIVALQGLHLVAQGHTAEGAQLAADALSRPGESGVGLDAKVIAAVFVLRVTGELQGARQALDREIEEARRQSAPLRLAWALDGRAMVTLRTAEVRLAEADARTAVELIDAVLSVPMAVPLCNHAEALLELGRVTDAHDQVQRAPLDEDGADSAARAQALRIRARIRAQTGQVQAALADVGRIARLASRYNVQNPAIMPWRTQAASLHALLGDAERASGLVDEELDMARAVGSSAALGAALRVRGLLNGPAGLVDLAEAVEVLEPTRDRLEYLRALIDLGAARRRAGQRTEARELVRGALDQAARLGARALADRAKQELVISGGRPRRLELQGRDSLTPSERRVAALAADGHTNREIAQALFVTRRTVETHLTSAYRKLDISARTQLPQALKIEMDAEGH